MKRYAKITGGVVERVQPYPETGFVEVPPDTVPGQLDNGDGTFSNPPPSPAPVPVSISKLQLKYALGTDWPTVKAYIDADPSLLEDWTLASEIHRASTLVNTAATALGYTPAQMDDIFRAGVGIAV